MPTLEELIESAKASGETTLDPVVRHSRHAVEAEAVRRRFGVIAAELERVARKLDGWNEQHTTLHDNLGARLQGLADRMADDGTYGQTRLDELTSAMRSHLMATEQKFQEAEGAVSQLDTQRRAAVESATTALEAKLASMDGHHANVQAAQRKVETVAVALGGFVGRATVLADRGESALLHAEGSFHVATEAKTASAELAGRIEELEAEIAGLQNAGADGDPNDPGDGVDPADADLPADAAAMIAERQSELDELVVEKTHQDDREQEALSAAMAMLALARGLRQQLSDDSGPASLDAPFPLFNADGGAAPQSQTRLEQAWAVARDDWRSKVEALWGARLEALVAELTLLTRRAEYDAWLAERAESEELRQAVSAVLGSN